MADEDDIPTRPPRLPKMNRGQLHKRRTPSAPMAALAPTPQVVEAVESESDTTMDPRTRDELLLKTVARVERIDTEVGVLIESMVKHTEEMEASGRTQRELIDSITTFKKKMETVKKLLVDVLVRLPEPENN